MKPPTDQQPMEHVWCETCQHRHIPTIPAVTWLCRQCGWGQWFEADAQAHIERQPGHVPYRVGHWIPARIRGARADERERIAKAIEALPIGGFTPDEGDRLRGVCETIEEAARIARTGGRSES